MIHILKDSKGVESIYIAEKHAIITNDSEYYITNKDGRGIAVSSNELIKVFEKMIDGSYK